MSAVRHDPASCSKGRRVRVSPSRATEQINTVGESSDADGKYERVLDQGQGLSAISYAAEIAEAQRKARAEADRVPSSRPTSSMIRNRARRQATSSNPRRSQRRRWSEPNDASDHVTTRSSTCTSPARSNIAIWTSGHRLGAQIWRADDSRGRDRGHRPGRRQAGRRDSGEPRASTCGVEYDVDAGIREHGPRTRKFALSDEDPRKEMTGPMTEQPVELSNPIPDVAETIRRPRWSANCATPRSARLLISLFLHRHVHPRSASTSTSTASRPSRRSCTTSWSPSAWSSRPTRTGLGQRRAGAWR